MQKCLTTPEKKLHECKLWQLVNNTPGFLFLPERSAFGIIGSGSWYIEGGEKFEGEGRKGLLSQGGCEPPVHYNSTWSALHNHQIVHFSPHKKCLLAIYFSSGGKRYLGSFREVGVGWGGVGRSVIARRPRRQYITTTLHTWWALRTIQLFSLLPPKYHLWWK